MLEIIPTLLTPAMLAIAPPNAPAPTINYNWHCQTAAAVDSSGKVIDVNNGTMRGSNSYVGQSYTIDDWNSD